jgi:MFS transporter, DHA2 family, multidrug resistance protein
MTPEAGPTAGPREWIGLGVIALPCMLYSMDLTVLNLALPAITAELRPSASQLLWIVDIYGFLVAGSLVTMGTLGDRIGRRRLLLIGAALFSVSSMFAAFSTSSAMLIGARALLGVAGATLAPSTLSLIRNMFRDPDQRRVAVGLWVTSYSLGAAIGPLVGGVLLEYFWWGSVFLAGIPVMALLLVLGPVLLPEFKDPQAGRIDSASAALSIVAVLLAIYGLKQVAQSGLGAAPVMSIVASVATGAFFVRRQRRLSDPLIDLGLFRTPAFVVALAAYTVASFVALGFFVLAGQYMQLVLGLSPLRAGLWTLPLDAAFIAGSVLAPVLARRAGPGFVMAGGLALSALGFGALSRVEGPWALAILVAGFVTYSLCLSPVVTLATALIIESAPPERAGAASAISETGSELGGALGIAILGSVVTLAYRRAMAGGLPIGVPPEAVAAARATLGGAVAVVGQLPPCVGAELLEVARGAFSRAMETTAIISAAVVLTMSVIAGVVLRRVGAGERPVP